MLRLDRPSIIIAATAAAVVGTAATGLAEPASQGAFGISGKVPASKVSLRVILDKLLDRPTALAFNPHDGVLWIVNYASDGSTVVVNPGSPLQKAKQYFDDSAHFMNNPTAIAFSRMKNEFATVQDTENDYNGHAHANHFMGPTLWTADLKIFQGGTKSHLDMLHHSPDSVGIAAGAPVTGVDRREYWVFNGQSGCIDRYFFNKPHQLGGDDHHDGLTLRYGSGLSRVAGVPGHLALDLASKKLYIADTGHGRIARLDTKTSTSGSYQIPGHHPETPLYLVPKAKLESVTTASAGLSRPAGLILKDGKLVVSDHATGRIKVLDLAGKVLGEVDTKLGANAVTGLAETPDGRLYLLDAKKSRLLELVIAP